MKEFVLQNEWLWWLVGAVAWFILGYLLSMRVVTYYTGTVFHLASRSSPYSEDEYKKDKIDYFMLGWGTLIWPIPFFVILTEEMARRAEKKRDKLAAVEELRKARAQELKEQHKVLAPASAVVDVEAKSSEDNCCEYHSNIV